MSEHDQSNWLISAMIVLGAVLFGSTALVWSTGDGLSTVYQRSQEAKAAAPSAPSQADATAGLEKRVLNLEAKLKAPPRFDTSQIEAQLKALGAQVAAVQTQLGSFKGTDFDALETKLETRIDEARTTNPESFKPAIDALQTDIRNLHTRFDQLSQQVTPVTAPDDLKHSASKSQRSRSR